jgi:tripartite-type tricarboxylate transporter receptor subunit TctC
MGSRNAFTGFGLYINILLGIFLLGSSFAGFSQTGGVEKWPVRPIKMVIPFSAGGPLDHLARKIGQKLTDALGANVVIDNRAGANGIIGSDHVAKSLADGYTMLFMTGSFTANPALY